MFIQFRTVGKKHVVCMIYERDGREIIEPLKSKAHLVETLVAIGDPGSHVGFSSTIDFPEDETDDPEQIKLAKELWT